MLCCRPLQRSSGCPQFQSSPALTGGCYVVSLVLFKFPLLFQSSPALTGGCYGQPSRPGVQVLVFQSSPALTGGCYVLARCCRGSGSSVSILTRPYGRMLWPLGMGPSGVCLVSILTRPYGRMLWLSRTKRSPATPCFNPHPPLRADAMGITAQEGSTMQRFQSSPALTGGCYVLSVANI